MLRYPVHHTIASANSGNHIQNTTATLPELISHLRFNTRPRFPIAIAEAHLRLIHSSHEIESLRAAIQTLETEQFALARYVNHSTSLLSPIRKLPVELLGKIFAMHCTRGIGNIVGEKPHYPALNLSHVSFFWREVMFSRPELWGNLEVRLEQMSKGSVGMLKLLLERSQSAALNLRVSSGYWNSSVETNNLSWEALTTLLDQSHRWTSATLRLDYQLFQGASERVLRAATRNPFPILQHLDVSWFDCRIAAVGAGRAPIRLFERVHSLRSLIIPHHDDCFLFPLSDLQVLKLTNVHRSPALVLEQTTSLQHLSIHNFAIRDPGLGATPTTISNITHLDIQVSSYFQSLTLHNLFEQLELPCLASFSVSEPFHRYLDRRTWSQDAFISLVKRSQFRLKQLSIKEILIAGDELLDILALCPDLKEFTFFEWQSNSSTRKLLMGLVSASVVPRLAYLALRVAGSSVEHVGNVLAAREAACIPLEEVSMQGVDMVDGSADFSSVTGYGTRVVIRHEPTAFKQVLVAVQ